MKKRIIVNIYTLIVVGGIMLFSLALLACPELPSEGNDSPTKKGTTPPSPYSFSLSKVLYAAVKDKKVPADTMVNDDKSGVTRIIFKGLGAKKGDTLSVIHVDDKGKDANDGSTWTKAKHTIGAALAGITDASANKLYLVLIGSGTYKITNTLNMQNHVAIIGGFDASSDGKSGYESSEATIISGGDSVQVFYNGDLDKPTKSTAVLAGVTITKGTITYGGGMHNESSSPTITNTTFSENSAADCGGGMYNSDSSSPTITHTTFSGNTASIGGGMYNSDSSSPTITHTTFSGNTAEIGNGGGMYNESSSPTITHTTFSGNTAETGNGGGMYNESSSLTITYTTFSGNKAETGNGGGMYNNSNSLPEISSSIFWSNTKGSGNTSSQIENSADSTPVVTHSIVQGGYDANDKSNNIINQDPLLGTLTNNGGFVETIAITAGSPAINKGLYVAHTDTTYYYSTNETDWFTDPKLTKGKTTSLPVDAMRYTTDARGYTYKGRPDMGAYEYEGTAP